MIWKFSEQARCFPINMDNEKLLALTALEIIHITDCRNVGRIASQRWSLKSICKAVKWNTSPGHLRPNSRYCCWGAANCNSHPENSYYNELDYKRNKLIVTLYHYNNGKLTMLKQRLNFGKSETCFIAPHGSTISVQLLNLDLHLYGVPHPSFQLVTCMVYDSWWKDLYSLSGTWIWFASCNLWGNRPKWKEYSYFRKRGWLITSLFVAHLNLPNRYMLRRKWTHDDLTIQATNVTTIWNDVQKSGHSKDHITPSPTPPTLSKPLSSIGYAMSLWWSRPMSFFHPHDFENRNIWSANCRCPQTWVCA